METLRSDSLVCNLDKNMYQDKYFHISSHMYRNVGKCNFGHVSPMKTQISMHSHLSDQSLLINLWTDKDPSLQQAGSKDFDLTVWKHRLICQSPLAAR